MKIAMFTNNYLPFVGGVPISIERLSKGLKDLGHEVVIFAPAYGEGEQKDSREVCETIRYHSFHRRFRNGMAIPDVLDRRIEKEFAQRKFDVIHVHHPFGIGNVAVLLSRKYHIPLVFTYHTRYEEYLHYLKPFQKQNCELTGKMQQTVKDLLPIYLNHFMKHCSLVFAPSRDMKEELLRQKDVPIVQVLPTGLPEEAYKKDSEKIKKIRKKYLKDEKYLLCTVSRLEKEKNLYFLLDSISQLDQSLNGTFKMMIIGDGGEKNALQDYVRKIGLEQRVLFTGAISNKEIRHYLGASDLFVFSSKSETQGIVLSEAMAAGLPVVAVKACGVRDIVKNGTNGFMTAEDTKTFAEVTGRVLVHEEMRKKMGEEALATARDYEINKVAKQAVAGYESAIEVWWNNYERRGYRYECRKADAV